LLLHIVFASSFTLLIKWAHVRDREHVITIGAINYIVAAVAVLPVFLTVNPQPVSWGAIWTGGSMGAIYFVAFFFAFYSIKKVGASSTTVVSVLSILLPIGFAAIVWNESPNLIQTAGIGLALLALTLIGAQTNRLPSEESKSTPAWIVPTVLFLFFLLCGCARLSQEAFKYVSDPDHRTAFILSAFSIAAIPSIVILIRGRRFPRPMEFAIGVLMGLSNILQTYFILLALHHFEGFIVFPLASAGGLVLTTLVATGLLGEQLNRRTYLGILVSVIALFLLYWVPG
jgi:drug/metabolite transporter (DMT)-like permease